MNLVWTQPARQDLLHIFNYIAEHNPIAAEKLLASIRERAQILREHPLLGRIGRVEGTREFVVSGSP